MASVLRADLVLIDERKARGVAKRVGLTIAGSLAVLELAAKARKIADIRSVYLSLLDQDIYFDERLLEESLARLGLAKLRN